MSESTKMSSIEPVVESSTPETPTEFTLEDKAGVVFARYLNVLSAMLADSSRQGMERAFLATVSDPIVKTVTMQHTTETGLYNVVNFLQVCKSIILKKGFDVNPALFEHFKLQVENAYNDINNLPKPAKEQING